MEKNELHSIRVVLEDVETGKKLMEKTGTTVLVVTSDMDDRADDSIDVCGSLAVQGNLGALAMVFATHPRGRELVNAALQLQSSMETIGEIGVVRHAHGNRL